MEELLEASVNGLRRAEGNAGLGIVAEGGAEGVEDAEVLPRRLDTVDLHPEPLVELVEADLEARGVDTGSAESTPAF